MQRFWFFELFKKRLEFLILFNPLLLFYLHDFQSMHYLLMVLKFFLLCNFLLNFFLHGLFLKLSLSFLLSDHLNSFFELFLLLIYHTNFLNVLSCYRMLRRVIIMALICNCLNFFKYFNSGDKLILLDCNFR